MDSRITAFDLLNAVKQIQMHEPLATSNPSCLVHMLMKEEKFLRGCTHKAAQVSRIRAYVEDLEGQEA
jgi:hypothetical protein